MPIYEYKCPTCKTVYDVLHGIDDHITYLCDDCAISCHRVVVTAPALCIPPQHQSAGSKLKYYGIRNMRTGEGITEKTDVRDPPGITPKNKRNK